MRRGLIYYWRTHLAVLAASAVAASVVIGAIVIGDSARGSLRETALEGLGRIESVHLSEHFFREELAQKIGARPALLSGGSASSSGGARASGVQIAGVDERFLELYEDTDEILEALNEESVPPPAALNEPLAKELNLKVGSEAVLYAASRSGAHPENILGSRGADSDTEAMRIRVAHIMPARGVGRFSLRPSGSAPFNVFLRLDRLQRALGIPERANLAAVALGEDKAAFQKAFRAHADLSDRGLAVRTAPFPLNENKGDIWSYESPNFTLNTEQTEDLLAVARRLNLPAQINMTYVANRLEANGRMAPYSTVAALSRSAAPFPRLVLTDGSPAPPLDAEGVYINAWLAEDLGADVGDALRMAYFTLERGAFVEHEAEFAVRGVVQMSGAAVHPLLTPEIPGLGDSDNLSDWEETFPFDRNLIRPKDETYWDDYRAAPKAFFSMEAARRMWSRASSAGGGEATSIWVMGDRSDGERVRSALTAAARVPLIDARENALKASTGSTDFAGLFAGFSMFLIGSAALLVGLLFRLGVEERSGEVGLLLALGFTPWAVRRRFLAEGLALSGVGSAVGAAGAYAYSHLILTALQTRWRPAVGETPLSVHWSWESAALGWLLSTCAALAAVFWATRQLKRVSPRQLTAGAAAQGLEQVGAGRPYLSWVMVGFGCLLWFFSESPALFFGSGCLLLGGGMGLFRAWLRRSRRSSGRMGASDAKRNPSRSAASAALVACACFILVAVGANRRPVEIDDASTGGYDLMASSDAPLYINLNDPDARIDAGADLDAGVRVLSLRSTAGEDASCLNLYRPQTPRLLGASDEFIEQNRFQFVESIAEEGEKNPWRLLKKPIELGDLPAVPDEPSPQFIYHLPAIADEHSARWILHLNLGDALTVENERGELLSLRLVGLLKTSVFQSDLIVSEETLLRHFPSRGGFTRFLIESPDEDISKTAEEMERALRRYGFDAVSTETLLKRFHTIEETYLSAFQTLGSLGLLLGVVGLAVTQLRNALERRRELALLLAVGYRRSQLIWAASMENAFILLAGMALGAGPALAASAHQIRASSLLPLLITLAVVFAVGALTGAAASSAALQAPLLPALKGAR
ncbi:MAG: ABC transporter permease [Candidatus Poribacteria bacterium]|nr:ABC transporter permease [Candidatus Poribacteria bacterium]